MSPFGCATCHLIDPNSPTKITSQDPTQKKIDRLKPPIAGEMSTAGQNHAGMRVCGLAKIKRQKSGILCLLDSGRELTDFGPRFLADGATNCLLQKEPTWW